MTDLTTLGGDTSYAAAINENGQVAGSATNSAGQLRPYRWTGGTMSPLETLGGSEGYAYDLNDAGVVVGGSLGHALRARERDDLRSSSVHELRRWLGARKSFHR